MELGKTIYFTQLTFQMSAKTTLRAASARFVKSRKVFRRAYRQPVRPERESEFICEIRRKTAGSAACRGHRQKPVWNFVTIKIIYFFIKFYEENSPRCEAVIQNYEFFRRLDEKIEFYKTSCFRPPDRQNPSGAPSKANFSGCPNSSRRGFYLLITLSVCKIYLSKSFQGSEKLRVWKSAVSDVRFQD